MEAIPGEIIEDNTDLVGRSRTNSNNSVMLDIQKNSSGHFQISESRFGHWGNFSSSADALASLRKYIETHPFYRDYNFTLRVDGHEITLQKEVQPTPHRRAKSENVQKKISDTIQTPQLKKEPELKNADRSNAIEPQQNNRPENLNKSKNDDAAVPNSGDSIAKTKEAVKGGAQAGVIEFLAEGTDAVPMSFAMMGMATTGLVLYPIYSAVADKLHDEASDELNQAMQQDEEAAKIASGVGYFGATIISALIGPKAKLGTPGIRRWKAGPLQDAAAARMEAIVKKVRPLMNGVRAVARGVNSVASDIATSLTKKPLRGYVIVPFGGGASASPQGKKLVNKIGVEAVDIIYNDADIFIASDKRLKEVKKGLKTKMDSNHLFLAEWFRKGPVHLRGLEHYVPAVLLRNGDEHQGTFHRVFNEIMEQEGLFKKTSYTQAEIERAMLIAEDYYRNDLGGELGEAWANACQEFSVLIYSKVKK